ncbi:16S rRNA (cytosine(967)-C(5))-methyltransferase RsmB [Rheinheimera sp.]|jgi:16S rRNA (cytosine967-C5)-methyltransferase|uniref:16S rRNA (cytosine(967)-C(5))-methyltransferase RsmB n=1 Tax=Rheinheimera sp. TaxID=1869214 RepID=UPI0026388451|nr:16S rRNA (cytosine(967)-C(5))-methyltransferase RsmB [Rheinheimera sp.]MCA1931542.1 16S rRNA (cytosine(967)-C(5))-methyltransferase RsmB [Rheinheimera sp.]
MSKNLRALAATACYQVVDQGKSLSEVLQKAQQELESPLDKALLQEICFGVMRYLPQLETVCQKLMDKPLVKHLRPLQFLIYVGLYQLKFLRVPDHAAIGETVEAARALKGQSLTGLINAVLRSAQRQPEVFDFQEAPLPVRYNHPGWIIQQLQQAYPQQWQQILDENQQKAPLWLRVNQLRISPEAYLAALAEQGIAASQPFAYLPCALLLDQASDVTLLPGYTEGWFSVQDGAAQHAAYFLGARNKDSVLDACCAPGGKTCHILELAPEADVLALDKDPRRLDRVYDNLDRLGLDARVMAADAADPDDWAGFQTFDRILLDVPCSATGVIRRHPDIRWLRKKTDIAPLVELQQQILRKIWPLLKPDAELLYATCSVLPEENLQQIQTFLAEHPDAKLIPLSDSHSELHWQIMPGQQQMDGFFYAKLRKTKR